MRRSPAQNLLDQLADKDQKTITTGYEGKTRTWRVGWNLETRGSFLMSHMWPGHVLDFLGHSSWTLLIPLKSMRKSYFRRVMSDSHANWTQRQTTHSLTLHTSMWPLGHGLDYCVKFTSYIRCCLFLVQTLQHLHVLSCCLNFLSQHQVHNRRKKGNNEKEKTWACRSGLDGRFATHYNHDCEFAWHEIPRKEHCVHSTLCNSLPLGILYVVGTIYFVASFLRILWSSEGNFNFGNEQEYLKVGDRFRFRHPT